MSVKPSREHSVTEVVKKLEEEAKEAGAVHNIMQQVLDQLQAVQSRMQRVRHKVAVMSGKGGVGKSSVAVKRIASAADQGRSFTDQHPATPAAQAFQAIAQILMKGLDSSGQENHKRSTQ